MSRRRPCHRVPFELLLAVDLSKASLAAMQVSKDLALRLDAHVVVVHAFSPGPRAPTMVATLDADPYLPFLEAEADMQVQEAEDITTKWADALRREGLDVDVDARPGPATDVILAAAEDHDADLIVVARHGTGMVRRMLLGSVTQRLVEKSRRPVLVVPVH